MINRRKFTVDWGANLFSLGLLATTGIALNSLIVRFYGPDVLGVFNQVYAIYILGSQIATFGIQFSILKYVAEFSEDLEAVSLSVGAAVLSVATCAILTIFLIFAFFRYSSLQPYSAGVADGVTYVLPGLWFFAINKVLLNALNGRQANTIYAFFAGLRYLLIVLFFLVAIKLRVSGEQLPGILSASEASLSLVMAFAYRKIFPGGFTLGNQDWVKRHLHFGLRSIFGGLAVELNTRVDVLILGIFTNDYDVGIYSFAAFFVEGLSQLSVITRRLIDPMLTKLTIPGNHDALRQLLIRGRNIGAVGMAACGAASIALYPWYATWLGGANVASASWGIFVILTIGASFFVVYGAFAGVFSQSGAPLKQTWLSIVILVTNLGLNFALVPWWGIWGAAVATSLSFAVGTFYLRVLVYRHLGIRF